MISATGFYKSASRGYLSTGSRPNMMAPKRMVIYIVVAVVMLALAGMMQRFYRWRR